MYSKRYQFGALCCYLKLNLQILYHFYFLILHCLTKIKYSKSLEHLILIFIQLHLLSDFM